MSNFGVEVLLLYTKKKEMQEGLYFNTDYSTVISGRYGIENY